MPNTAPAVWAIVLTHGGAEEITAECFDSLLAQDYPALTVLLVDNASYDGSGERLRQRYPGIKYLNTGGNLGYTGGNNRGMQFALDHGAEFLLVMNNDTVLEPSCVSRLVESATRADRVGAVAPKILYYDDPRRIWFAGGDYSFTRTMGLHRRELQPDDPTEPPVLQEMTFATGCCFLMPAPVARSVGGFREDFFIYCEDLELSLRLTRAGYKLYYQPAARMLHREPPRRPDSTPFQILHRDRNRRRIARAHYTLPQRLRFAAFFYSSRAVRLAQYLARREWAKAGAILKGAVAR
jgi:GT2 family glycosyltransferase